MNQPFCLNTSTTFYSNYYQKLLPVVFALHKGNRFKSKYTTVKKVFSTK